MNNNVSITSNPLLICEGLPPFDQIQPEHVLPAMTQLLTELEQELQSLESEVAPTWTGLVEPLEKLGDRLSWSWGIVGHLMDVKNSPELREAYEAVQPKVVEFIISLSAQVARTVGEKEANPEYGPWLMTNVRIHL